MAELIARGKPDDMPVSRLQSLQSRVRASSILSGGLCLRGKEAEWQRLNRKYRKQQASVRAANSMRRTIDEAEMHGASAVNYRKRDLACADGVCGCAAGCIPTGELRLGTLSGGTNDGRYRPPLQAVFAEQS